MSDLAYIAIGSNLGDSPAFVQQAFDELQSLSAAPILRSSIWRTTPVDCPPGSSLFYNAVAGIIPLRNETAETLLSKLQGLERKFGRQPKTLLNEPRPLDLDLIAFGCEVRQSPALILPHPRAHQRRFVLEPLAEIAPDLLLPNQSKTVGELLRDLSTGERVERFTGSKSPA